MVHLKKTVSLILVIMLVMTMGTVMIGASTSDVTTLYFENSLEWKSVNAFYWGSSADQPAWPGVPAKDLGNNLWSFDFPSDCTGIIFNDGTNQSSDLENPGETSIAKSDGTLLGGTTYVFTWEPYSYVPVTTDPTTESTTTEPSESGEEVVVIFNVTIPEPVPEGTSISIGSTLNNWTPYDTDWFAEKVDDTHYRLTKTLDASYIGAAIEYKWTQQTAETADRTHMWDLVEEYENRTFTLSAGENIINDTVYSFKQTKDPSIQPSSPDDTAELIFNITIPYAIPDDANISMGSSLNNWDPTDTDWFAEKVDDTHYRLTKTLDASYIGLIAEYKWTLQIDGQAQMWGQVEVDAEGNNIANRRVTLYPGENIINDTIVGFQQDSGLTTVTGGTLEIVRMVMPQYEDQRERNIRIWLPEGYDPANTSKRYPVLYMHDGQNIFDQYTSSSGEWQVDESIADMMDAGYEGVIVVGVDHGALERRNELCPAGYGVASIGNVPTGEQYAEFIVHTLKPYIDEHYNTLPDRANTGIGGSSMGGLESFYMATTYPDIFGYALYLSPALAFFTDAELEKVFDAIDYSGPAQLPKMYLSCGGSDSTETWFLPTVIFTNEALLKRGYPADKLYTFIDESLAHVEADWAKLFPDAFKWATRSDPSDPTDPTEPATEGSEPTAPVTEATDPTEPATEGSEPTAPVAEATDPTEPATEGSEPTAPVTEATDPTEPATEGSEPTAPVAEATDSTEPATATVGSNTSGTDTSMNNPSSATSAISTNGVVQTGSSAPFAIIVFIFLASGGTLFVFRKKGLWFKK